MTDGGNAIERYVKSDPYPWPYNGDLRAANTALIVIDMQTDFCGKGGYIDLLGYDISLTRVCIEPISRWLVARGLGMRGRAGACWCVASRGGTSFRSCIRSRGRRSSTSREKDPFVRRTS